LLLGLLALAGFVALRPQLTSALSPSASGPTTVFLAPPAEAAVGQSVTVKLVANNAKELAGFQATLHFDPDAVHLTGALISDELARTGRGLLSLGPVIGYDTATLGAATCPVLVCESLADARVAQRQTQGVYGRVELARFEMVIVKPGDVTLTLSDVQLVAPDGAVLDTAATPSLTLPIANQ
jgi:hypothetical protein